MKKQKMIYVAALFLIALQSSAQIVNINPDPNGEPWITGDAIFLTPGDCINTRIGINIRIYGNAITRISI